MNRVLVVLVALFLVNLPFAHQAYTDHQISSSGREVEAGLLGSRTVEGDHLVEYRLPPSVDASRTRYSAGVDATTYAQARASKVLLVASRPPAAVGDPPPHRFTFAPLLSRYFTSPTVV